MNQGKRTNFTLPISHRLTKPSSTYIADLKATFNKREEELKALAHQLKDKEAEVAESYRQNAAQAKYVDLINLYGTMSDAFLGPSLK